MGLDTSHDAWHGAYSAFHRFRCAVARCIGIDLERMEGFESDIFGPRHGPAIPWSALPPHPLHKFLNHSDCDGEIAVEDLVPIADALEAILPPLEAADVVDAPGGHLSRGYAHAARRFAAGCRLAASRNEPLGFH